MTKIQELTEILDRMGASWEEKKVILYLMNEPEVNQESALKSAIKVLKMHPELKSHELVSEMVTVVKDNGWIPCRFFH